MIISYTHNFIFIHNPKVAGSSITQAFMKYALKDSPKNEYFGKIMNRFGILGYYANNAFRRLSPQSFFSFHDSAMLIMNNIHENTWNNSFKFGFVRNPWDLQVSLFHFINKSPWHPNYQTVKNCRNFKDFIHTGIHKLEPSQSSYFTNNEGEIIVDFVGKIENLNKDFNYISDKLSLNVKLPHVNRSDHAEYKKYYDADTRKIVEESNANDISIFKYTF